MRSIQHCIHWGPILICARLRESVRTVFTKSLGFFELIVFSRLLSVCRGQTRARITLAYLPSPPSGLSDVPADPLRNPSLEPAAPADATEDGISFLLVKLARGEPITAVVAVGAGAVAAAAPPPSPSSVGMTLAVATCRPAAGALPTLDQRTNRVEQRWFD